jgi:hypothetical protein
MDNVELLEKLGRVESPDPDVLERTADVLSALAAGEAKLPVAAVRGGASEIAPLRQAIKTDHHPRSVQREGKSRRRRWVVRSAAAVVVLVGAASGVSVLLRPGSPASPGTAAAAVLTKLARVAADQPVPSAPGPGQYLYVDSVETYTDGSSSGPSGGPGFTVLLPEHRQIWIAPDGSGQIRETFGQPTFLSAQDRANWEADGDPPIPHAPTDMSFGPGGLEDGPTDLWKLPMNPAALGAEIASRKIEGGPPGPAEDFTQVADLLRETDASPALRSALYQVAAGLPGVESLGTVTDHSGRTGVGVAYVNDGLRHELIFDPETSALLGESYTIVGPGSGYDAPVGTVVGWEVYLQSSIVNSLPPSPATNPPQTVMPVTPAPSSSTTTPSTILAP